MDVTGNRLKELTENIVNTKFTQQQHDSKKAKGIPKTHGSIFEWSRQNQFALLDALLNEQTNKYKVISTPKQEIDRKIAEFQDEFQRSKMLAEMFISVFETEIVFTFSQAVNGFKNVPQLNMNVIYNAIQYPGQFTYPMVKNVQFNNTVSLKTLSCCLENFYSMVFNCIQFVDPDNTVPQHVMQILCGDATSTDVVTQVTIHCLPKGGDVAKMNGNEIHVNLYSISYYAEMFLTLWVLYHVQHYGIKQAISIVLSIIKMMETLPNHPYFYKRISEQLGISPDVVEQIHFCGCVIKEAIRTHEKQECKV